MERSERDRAISLRPTGRSQWAGEAIERAGAGSEADAGADSDGGEAFEEEIEGAPLIAELRAKGDSVPLGLREELAKIANMKGLLDVGYDRIETEIGELLLAATPRGLVRIAFASEGIDRVLDRLAERIGPRVLRHPSLLAEPARAVRGLLRGERPDPSLALDLSLARGYRREVLAALRRIAPGQTRSYAQIAAETGRPRAVRAVGTACATNPLPLLIPCHRVVRSDGSLGGYLGGLDLKRRLLEREAG